MHLTSVKPEWNKKIEMSLKDHISLKMIVANRSIWKKASVYFSLGALFQKECLNLEFTTKTNSRNKIVFVEKNPSINSYFV